MNTATRLGLYGAGLAVVFGGAFTAADAVIPENTVSNWTNKAKGHEMTTGNAGRGTPDEATGHGEPPSTAPTAASTEAMVRGVTTAVSGYLLSPVTVPGRVGESGELSFQVLNAQGEPETSFAVEHDKQLHLIVVRTDGTKFRHVHPTMDADGTWSLPWDWAAAGTYRIYADLVPDGEGAEPVTLTRTVEVAGRFTPAPATPTTTASVDGFTVNLIGDLVAGSSSELTLTVSRDGKPVTSLQPYLGAFGHLVALRDGDLAYLHVHPEGQEPAAGQLSGPEIEFAAEAPTPGRYLLYLDFRVDGKVHSAPFVLDTKATGATDATPESPTEQDGHSTTDSDSDADSGAGHDH
jgi:hypothetical protein